MTNVKLYGIFVSNETKIGEIMTRTMQQKVLDALHNADIFSCVDNKSLKTLVESYVRIASFEKNDTVFGSENSEIGILIKGSVQVEKKGLVISRLFENDIFGTVTLYNDNKEFVNTIKALCDCTVIFISRSGVEFLIENSADFSKEYIKYLSKRIYFLNKRIDSFGESSTKDKLFTFIKCNAKNGEYLLASGITTLSKVLNISRASIYRAFDELEAEGKIIRDNKSVKITEE